MHLIRSFVHFISLIHLQEYPNYNFIGLVIGPRGATQKAMEKETGAKIVIRGRGSVKEGAKLRGGGGPDDEDLMHVLITGDTESQVKRRAVVVGWGSDKNLPLFRHLIVFMFFI
jgi:hypothetical protein